MVARLVCSQCGAILAEDDRDLMRLKVERGHLEKCPKCKRLIPRNPSNDRVLVEGRELGVLD